VSGQERTEDRDGDLMAAALAAATAADHRASPNPTVGAVLVAPGGEVLGTAATEPVGGRHAEVQVIATAGERTRGATLYVTLEPCDHHGRTAPCTSAIVAAGIARVVVATHDPNPLTRGRGVQRLRQAGIAVDVGVHAAAAVRLHRMFLTWMTLARPFVTLKFAASLDGRVVTAGGQARWISSHGARRVSHLLRHRHDAILVGIGTVLADDPELTTRFSDQPDARQPLRVVLDSRLRTPPDARVLARAAGGTDAPALIVTGPDADAARVRVLEAAGAEILSVPREEGRLHLPALLDHLSRRDVSSVLVEGGPTVHGSFRDAGLVDGVVALLSPRLLGGDEALAAVGGRGAATLADAPLFADVEVTRAGVDVVVAAYSDPHQLIQE
jgi:diaminohydroxyphosphoribosylaminopyrimidine deaminase/5-amino-6-(5-phosphoribosylamino)uracil reductase